jgi:hypothetical protein
MWREGAKRFAGPTHNADEAEPADEAELAGLPRMQRADHGE